MYPGLVAGSSFDRSRSETSNCPGGKLLNFSQKIILISLGNQEIKYSIFHWIDKFIQWSILQLTKISLLWEQKYKKKH